MLETVQELCRKMEEDDKNGYTNTSEYVSESLRDDVNKVDAYLNSKHTSGPTDSLGRDKPFFNITVAARNIWFRATDLDRKNVKIKATKKKHKSLALCGTILLQEWMRKNFGQVLNDWGLSLANYGSSVLKFLEQGGELIAKVIDWNHLICDSIDFENNPVIEKLEFTPAQLKQNKLYDQDIVKQLLDARETRKTSGGMQKDNKSNYVTVYEVHGELPLSYLTDNEDDEDEYVQQMHVVTFVKSSGRGKFDDFTLYSGREKNPYIITHLIKRDGYTLAGGAPKHLFENQWMVNHNAKQIKDQLDLTSKTFFQTSDGNFIGQNALGAMENGDILIHALNAPLTQLNNKSDIVASLSQGQQWKALGNEIVGISESMLGQSAPSGTAWRQVNALLQENHSLFELMTENKGLALEEMLRRFVIPHLKKKMDTTEEISAILSEQQITQIDQMYVPNEAIRRDNQKIIDATLGGGIYTLEQQAMNTQMEAQKLQDEQNQQGNQRFIKPSDISTKTWKKALEGLEWEVEIDITAEQKDMQNVMTTLNTALQVMVNPAYSQNKKAQFVVNRILEESGVISPLELSQFKDEPMNPAMPVGQNGGSVAGNNTAIQ